MAQSLSLLYVHIVFHIGNSMKTIRSKEQDKLYKYMNGILKANHCPAIRIGGMPDHIHILCILSKNMPLANLVREVKRSTTLWLKSQDTYYGCFKWQGGYGAFSVGVSSYEKTIQYIENQPVHHEKRSFQEEYILFLKESGMEYDKKYLWTD